LYNLQKDFPENNENILMLNKSIDRMTRIIEQMLDLYRASPEQINASFAEVDAYKLAQSVIQNIYPAIANKQQEIELIGSSCMITANEFAMRSLLKNLIDNANKYSPEHGKISVQLQRKEKTVSFIVEDSGPGIPEALSERVFERFYRVSGDQHESAVVGCGLGLSIVRHIVDLHHGSVQLDESSLGGLKVTVTLMLQGQGENEV
jgi:two-component system sensor histidine kinase QseC